jgi:CheY-like chemotaxis protein
MMNLKQKIEVLWIDDEVIQNDPKVEVLEEGGDIAVSIARDATEALDYFRLKKPDIVLLDIMMPPGKELSAEEVKNGYETGFALLRKMRNELNLDMPVIILTVYPKMMPEQETKDEKMNIVEYLAKPVKMKFLAELIRRHVIGDTP